MTIGTKLQMLSGSGIGLLAEVNKLAIASIKTKFDLGEILSIADANLIDDLYNIHLEGD